MKEEFIELLKQTNREGIEGLLEFLEKSDFYTAPASTRFHGSEEGGLLKHSLKVYEVLKHKVENNVLGLEVPEDTVIITALLHDICKTNFYTVDYRNAKNALGVWEKVPYYTVEDTIPYGHGEKSVYILSGFMRLTRLEAMIINWHMGGFDARVKGGSYSLSDAYYKFPLAAIFHTCDLLATYLDETK